MRFEYVPYDKEAIGQITAVKNACKAIERDVIPLLPESREKALAITKLQEFYLWCSESVRMAQMDRTPPIPSTVHPTPADPVDPVVVDPVVTT